MELVFIGLFFLLPIPVNVYLAVTRGKSVLLFLIFTFFLGWIITLILAIMSPVDLEARSGPETHMKCPDCAELILLDAKVCKHCGCRVGPPQEVAA